MSFSTSAGAILVVEDVFVRSFVRSALAPKGHEVICLDPLAGVDLLRHGAQPIRLIITNRPDLFTEYTDVPLLYMAAFPDPVAIKPFRRSVYLRKPFHPSELLRSIEQLLS